MRPDMIRLAKRLTQSDLVKIAEHLETKAKKRVVDPLILALAALMRARFRKQAKRMGHAFAERLPVLHDIQIALAAPDQGFSKRFAKLVDRAYQGGSDMAAAQLATEHAGVYGRTAEDLKVEIDATSAGRVESVIKLGLADQLDRGEMQRQVSELFTDWAGKAQESRAAGIGLQEISEAFHSGILAAARASGQDLLKEWSAEPTACDLCEGNTGEQIDLGEPFASGDDAPPAHNWCRCSLRLIPAAEK